ncbi:ClbS/DfsB family four-helix bundle protein [Solibacillus sp. FSL W8-0372]|uniref:ClbS/DfsB family four-helix bundle protein n=1 Tax=Solibacillus sp. FSL W8-0372 TaxID=2921713 RepID=UPI0030CDDFC9
MEGSKKQQFIEQVQQSFDDLTLLINQIPARKRTVTVETNERDKNFRDVLMHLYEWHAMLERWYREGMDGDTPIMPAPGYKWRNLHELNFLIWQQYQDLSLSTAMKRLTLSHQRVMHLINLHTEEEIFTKKYYKWTKTSNLYSYFAANTVNHYDWAIKKCGKIAEKITQETS